MRIVTRPDFDGIVCAVFLYEAENITQPVKWVSPNDMQKNRVDIHQGDIIANLPYHEECSLWFDHHFSNQLRHPVAGLFKIAPSAAGIIFEHYRSRFTYDYTELSRETDKVDSAELSLNEILYPEKYPYVLLSMTIHSHIPTEEPYWNHLTDLLRGNPVEDVLRDPEVRKRCDAVITENMAYKTLLEKHTTTQKHVSITDFRTLKSTPYGNRFLIYSMFQKTSVSVKIGFEENDENTVVVKVGHSILNRTCNVNVGQMLSYFGGGGHRGAGACRFHVSMTNAYLPKIIDILLKNDPDGSVVVKTKRSSRDRRAGKDRRKTLSAAYFEKTGIERRRKKDRRVRKEQRKNWERVNRWKSHRCD